MTITLKAKAPLVVPPSVQRKARLKAGDRVEFRATPGKITIVSKPPAAPTADDEYTPEQRCIIEAQLAEGLEDIKKGRTYGPFDTAEEAIKFLHKEIRTRKARDKRKTNIAEQYQSTYRRLKTLPCDVFLGPHGRQYNLEAKYARMQAGAAQNPFIDPAGCRQYVDNAEARFMKQLEEERRAGR